jgi:hypothetical protein
MQTKDVEKGKYRNEMRKYFKNSDTNSGSWNKIFIVMLYGDWSNPEILVSLGCSKFEN